jgi:conserved repeat domain
VIPGGFWVYTHFLSNTGNVIEGDAAGSVVTLTAAETQAGWNSTIYWDTDNDGTLDAADAVLADLSTIGGLNPGQTVRLFVRVSAPAGAPFGQVNVTTLAATATNVAYTVAAPSAQATDVTTVINGQIQLEKWQALDAGCDGAADAAYVQTDLTTGAVPGACIRYELVVTNTGTASVNNVTLTDATPANTVYSAVIPAFTSQGTVTTEPADGATGSIVVDIGTLAPGVSVTVRFGIRINP